MVLRASAADRHDILLFANDIDLNMSSGIKGLDVNICKLLLLHFPDKSLCIFASSVFSDSFTWEWAVSTVKGTQRPVKWSYGNYL